MRHELFDRDSPDRKSFSESSTEKDLSSKIRNDQCQWSYVILARCNKLSKNPYAVHASLWSRTKHISSSAFVAFFFIARGARGARIKILYFT